jgi:hypothetical protein
MQEFLKPGYTGRRWEIVFGRYEGVEQFAVNELQRMVQRYLPYIVAVRPDGSSPCRANSNGMLLGTPDSHRAISSLIDRGLLARPERPQGYTIAILKSPDQPEGRVAAIAGADAAGVLYGVEDFNARVLALGIAEDKPELQQQAFDAMPETAFSEAPAIDNRGIWTWGYTIYDYRRFLDNMARLRMNMLTIWNDCPPVNCLEVIDYAHSRGVRVILGFQWGWGLPGLSLHNPADRRKIQDSVLANYRGNYRNLHADGIYFQTLTEHHVTQEGGQSTAEAACKLVNEISRELLAEQGDLYIQFGLHATSIRDHYADLADLDERVVIVWEDAGAIPFSYNPLAKIPAGADSSSLPTTPEATIAYARKLATFRKGTEFAMVPKGWTNLRWQDEFEHHGPFVLGERDAQFVRTRMRRRRRRWDQANALWLLNYGLAMRFYREVLACGPAKMTVTGLIEDGCFEESIQPGAAIFGETIWDPCRDEQELLRLAASPYYAIRQ